MVISTVQRRPCPCLPMQQCSWDNQCLALPHATHLYRPTVPSFADAFRPAAATGAAAVKDTERSSG